MDSTRHEPAYTYRDNYISGGNVHLGSNYHVHVQDPALEKRRRFLESLRFNEMNWRANQVQDAYPQTFEWILEEQTPATSRSWDDFTQWLQSDELWYWISGKAGSGKSTLMKFLISDKRTKNYLQRDRIDVQPLILSHFFWLSGKEEQRSLKGFLGSTLSQVCHLAPGILDNDFFQQAMLEMRRSLGDWSETALESSLLSAISLSGRPICLFLDGLDEFDMTEDVTRLIRLLEKIASFTVQKVNGYFVKICTSSRPEPFFVHYMSSRPHLRLQDLNRQDIEILITNQLAFYSAQAGWTGNPFELHDSLVSQLIEKADGVFLWVHLALKSVLRGMSNKDDVYLLKHRLTNLPSDMTMLYEQMWRRTNDDLSVYREESRRYFWLVADGPQKLLQFIFNTDETLQKWYLQSPEMDISLLEAAVEACRSTVTKINSRSAGILEVAGNFGLDRLDDLNASSEQCLACKENLQTPTKLSVMVRELRKYSGMRVQFFHRTAKDFLLGTESGRHILGPRQGDTSDEAILLNLTASWVHICLSGFCVDATLLFTHLKWCSDKSLPLKTRLQIFNRLETILMQHFRKWHHLEHDAESFHIATNPGTNITFVFCHGSLKDFAVTDMVGLAACAGCSDVVKHVVQQTFCSSYYQGYLVICLSHFLLMELSCPLGRRKIQWSTCFEVIECIDALLQSGADIRSKHPSYNIDFLGEYYVLLTPAEQLVLAIHRFIVSASTETVRYEHPFSAVISLALRLEREHLREATCVMIHPQDWTCSPLRLLFSEHSKTQYAHQTIDHVVIISALSDILSATLAPYRNTVSSIDENPMMNSISDNFCGCNMINTVKLFTNSSVLYIKYFAEPYGTYRAAESVSTAILSTLSAAYSTARRLSDLQEVEEEHNMAFQRLCWGPLNHERVNRLDILAKLVTLIPRKTRDRVVIGLVPFDPKKHINMDNYVENGALRMWSQYKAQGLVPELSEVRNFDDSQSLSSERKVTRKEEEAYQGDVSCSSEDL